jgi:TonB family protein
VPADAATSDALKGLSVREDRRAKETLYQPAYDTWTLYDFRTYPILRHDARGERALLLYASAQGERRIGIKRLDVEIDGVVHALTPARSEVRADDHGCRVVETAILEGQADLIRKIAAARQASITVVGVRSTTRFPLTHEELESFSRIVALHDAETLPPPEEPKPVVDGDQGMTGLTPPQIIRSTKVMPEFPVMARDRMARGKVTLHAVLRSDGTTDVVDVFKSSARYCGFEQAAIDAVRQWRYIPAQKDGKPVAIYFTIDIDFVWR